MMEPWRRVFREGIAPQLPLPALEALRTGLLKFDPRLRPGGTVQGPAPISYACAIGYSGWKGLHLKSAADVVSFFTEICDRANRILGDPGACSAFITWFDNNRREFVFPLLLSEVNRAIAQRTKQDEKSVTLARSVNEGDGGYVADASG
jgi:hypothetical protein